MLSARCFLLTLSLVICFCFTTVSFSTWPGFCSSFRTVPHSETVNDTTGSGQPYSGIDAFEYPDYCTTSKTVALTFDDTPDTELEDLLRLLKLHNATATFFENGPHHFGGLRDLTSSVRKILANGHQIGSHSWNHINMSDVSHEDLDYNLISMNDWLFDNFQIRTRFVRPPWGLCDDECLRQLASRAYYPVGYAIDVEDWRYSTANLVDLSVKEFEKWTYQWERTRSSRRRGPIVSLHAGYRPVVDTTAPAIMAYFERQGFRFASVAECLGFRRSEWYM
ncbi:Chitin deacetylase [Sphaceloma murrayae]|uniref:Chitin deacetylase n=1 Tax=Sphaceloma murrayae TaxID=2082308 RepID=A0A2K1QLY5_9PEZI|nr:Chitin deacetylase [Sphaceloma murrayae]